LKLLSDSGSTQLFHNIRQGKKTAYITLVLSAVAAAISQVAAAVAEAVSGAAAAVGCSSNSRCSMDSISDSSAPKGVTATAATMSLVQKQWQQQ
jgi:hypothetical protein